MNNLLTIGFNPIAINKIIKQMEVDQDSNHLLNFSLREIKLHCLQLKTIPYAKVEFFFYITQNLIYHTQPNIKFVQSILAEFLNALKAHDNERDTAEFLNQLINRIIITKPEVAPPIVLNSFYNECTKELVRYNQRKTKC